MTKRNLIFHSIFWVFILLYLLDYFYDGIVPIEEALLFSFIEASMYAVIIYLNLGLLIPKVYNKHGVWAYVGAWAVFLPVSFSLYFFLLGFDDFMLEYNLLRSMLSYSISFLLFSFISWLYWNYTEFQSQKEEKLILANEKLKMEMNQLKAQISPHFLFNSLNNIYSLTLSGHADAPVLVEKLSEILRYLVYEGENERVPLPNEVQLIENYIETYRIQRIKAAKNIVFKSSGVEIKHQIIPLTLITLVENGFKHGDLKTNPEGYFYINMNVTTEGQLLFDATNSKGKTNGKPGIGLSNLTQQLELSYPEKYTLNYDDKPDCYSVKLSVWL